MTWSARGSWSGKRARCHWQRTFSVGTITAQGLLISFDAYTIAPYAAGPQSVLIPYQVLRNVADPEGPLAQFLQ